MRKLFNVNFLAIIATLMLVSSCNDDKEKLTYMSALGEFKRVGTTEYYIDTDKGNKVLVLNSQELLRGGVKDNDRLLASFYINNEYTTSESVYNYDVTVVECVTIPVKKPVVLTEDNADKLGNDKIIPIGLWYGKNYLNFQYNFAASGKITHSLDLAEVQNAENVKEGFKLFEVRHNANKDTEVQLFAGITSFDLTDVKAQNPGLKGIIVRIQESENQSKVYELPFDAKDENQVGKFKANVPTGLVK